jgi:hypothetical protein
LLGIGIIFLASGWFARGAQAQENAPAPVPQPSPVPTASPGLGRPEIDIHGFVSAGAFVSTANNYIGESARGSVELFEAGINFSTVVAERLRVGLQLFSRDEGTLRDESPRVDWAYLDYYWRPWLGLRAGIIKMPFGLYNEYADIDTARLPILMPQSVYAIRNREALLSHTGFALYGSQPLGAAGELDYQAWLGTLSIPENALTISGATLDDIDTRYVTGAQLFWQPPIEGLRVGGTYVRASIDFDLTLDPATVMQLIAAGLVPADYDGKLVISQRPDAWWIVSAELVREDWFFAAEYSRAAKHQQTSLPDVIPAFDEDAEHFYGLVSYRLSARLETGVYYSVNHRDASDRDGSGPAFAEKFYAYQRDLAATLRFDVNDHWLWKVEGHFIDGTADLLSELNPAPERFWGLFLLRTTVTF